MKSKINMILALLALGISLVACGGGEGPRSKSAAQWAKGLESKDSATRLAAARALGEMFRQAGEGKTAPPAVSKALVAALADRRQDVREEAALALAWSGSRAAAVPVLVAALRDCGVEAACKEALRAPVALNPQVRIESSLTPVLQSMRAKFPAARPLNAAPYEAVAPARAMMIMAEKTKQFADKREAVRVLAAVDLGRMAGGASFALPLLGRALADQSAPVRKAAAWAMGQIGPEAMDYCTALAGLLLNDADGAVRVAAAQALAAIDLQNDKNRFRLFRSIKDADPRVRVAVAMGLRGIGPLGRPVDEPVAPDALAEVYVARNQARLEIEPVVNALAGMLGDRDANVRAAAALALGRIAPDVKATAPKLLALLKDSNEGVRAAAVWALGDLDYANAPIAASLAGLLQDPSAPMRAAAASALARTAPDKKGSVELMLKAAAAAAAPEVRASAARALGRLGTLAYSADGGRAGDALIKLLKDPNETVRATAAGALGRVERGGKAAAALADALDDAQPAVRQAAALALARCGLGADRAVAGLGRMLARDGSDRLAGAVALAWLDRSTSRSLEVITAALADPAFWRQGAETTAIEVALEPQEILKRMAASASEPDLRAETILAAGWMGEKARPAAPALVGILRSRRNPLPLRNLAATALVCMVPECRPPSFPSLLQSIRDERAEQRLRAATALSLIGPVGEPALPDLVQSLRDGANPLSLRIAAMAAVGAIGPKSASALPVLTETLTHDPDPNIRAAVASALGLIGPAASPAASALVEALKAPESPIREAAALALGKVAPDAKTAVPALAGALRDPETRVRLAAAAALGQLGPAAREALPALTVSGQNDRSEQVRQWAQSAMEKIGG